MPRKHPWRGGSLDDNGALSHLRSTSPATLEHRYNRWLGWLVRQATRWGVNTIRIDLLTSGTREERVYATSKSFKLFCVYYFTKYFTYSIAPFHDDFFQDFDDLVYGRVKDATWIGSARARRAALQPGAHKGRGHAQAGVELRNEQPHPRRGP